MTETSGLNGLSPVTSDNLSFRCALQIPDNPNRNRRSNTGRPEMRFGQETEVRQAKKRYLDLGQQQVADS